MRYLILTLCLIAGCTTTQPTTVSKTGTVSIEKYTELWNKYVQLEDNYLNCQRLNRTVEAKYEQCDRELAAYRVGDPNEPKTILVNDGHLGYVMIKLNGAANLTSDKFWLKKDKNGFYTVQFRNGSIRLRNK